MKNLMMIVRCEVFSILFREYSLEKWILERNVKKNQEYSGLKVKLVSLKKKVECGMTTTNVTLDDKMIRVGRGNIQK